MLLTVNCLRVQTFCCLKKPEKPDKANPEKPKPDKPDPDEPNLDKPKPDKPKPDKPKPDKPKKDEDLETDNSTVETSMTTAAEVDTQNVEANEEVDPCALPCYTRLVRDGVIVFNILGDGSCLDLCIPKRALAAVQRLGSECGPCEEGSRFSPTAAPSDTPSSAPSLSLPPTTAPTPEPTPDRCVPCTTFGIPEGGVVVTLTSEDGNCFELCLDQMTANIGQEDSIFECGVCEGGLFSSSTSSVTPSVMPTGLAPPTPSPPTNDPTQSPSSALEGASANTTENCQFCQTTFVRNGVYVFSIADDGECLERCIPKWTLGVSQSVRGSRCGRCEVIQSVLARAATFIQVASTFWIETKSGRQLALLDSPCT